STWRMERGSLGEAVPVNDAYNANPDSMRAALRAVVAMAQGRRGRTIAVLGEMLELGERSEDEHRAVGRLAADLGVSLVVVVGPGAHPIGAAATGGATEVVHVADPDSATSAVTR